MLRLITKCTGHAATSVIEEFNLISTNGQGPNSCIHAAGKTIGGWAFGALMAMRMEYYFREIISSHARTSGLKRFRPDEKLLQQPSFVHAAGNFVRALRKQIQIIMFQRIDFGGSMPTIGNINSGSALFKASKTFVAWRRAASKKPFEIKAAPALTIGKT